MKGINLVVAMLFVSRGFATDVLTPEKIEADIKLEELERNLWNLNRIGAENGGNRAFGLPGYKASMDYVLERAVTRFHPEYDTYVQPFNHTFAQVLSISVTGPEGEAVDVVPLIYNPGTDAAGIEAPLIDTPVDDARGSACFEDQWAGIDASNKLALVKRGTCPISDKLKLAKAHGALGVIMYNNAPGIPSSATLGAENVGLLVPIGTIQQAVGETWKARLAAGETLTVALQIDAEFDTRETWNIIAETKAGSPDNVIMLGAHLDSVQAGPGVNDDGSGSSALIELMTAFRTYTGFANKVRFAWWGAEESGLIGSLHYTSSLAPEEADRIRFYFNYDMIGSPAPQFAVYTGDNPGDLSGAQPLKDYLIEAGRDAYFGSFGSSSDYVGFLELGIPSSGIFTGAGAPTDPCYHLACDTISNVDLEALTTNAKAAGVVAARMALSLEGVPPRNKTTLNPRGKNHIRAQFDKWKRATEHASAEKSCSHKEKSTV
ncbi:peptidase family M28 [Hypoxylon crocopeplum]|nr:peptidase family M28 [Hypoxylon crocopeplum]